MANKKDAQLKLDKYLEDFPRNRRRVIERGNKTGAWLTVLPSIVNGMVLSSDEFRDGLAIRYGYDFLNPPEKCDGCGAKFSVGHALQCKTGGLVNMRHNEVKDELGYLAGIATSSNTVRDEPLITQGHAATGGGAANANANPQPTDQQATPDPCLDSRRDFTPYGVKRLIGTLIVDHPGEALIARILSTKFGDAADMDLRTKDQFELFDHTSIITVLSDIPATSDICIQDLQENVE
eukprot:scaffold8879_cov44-Attheya_sp.AAC.3